MKVEIDGVPYIPADEMYTIDEWKLKSAYDKILALEIDQGFGKITLRVYLKTLLKTLWHEEEGFSGKHPFGDSGWKSGVKQIISSSGLIKNDSNIDDLVWDLIDYSFQEK